MLYIYCIYVPGLVLAVGAHRRPRNAMRTAKDIVIAIFRLSCSEGIATCKGLCTIIMPALAYISVRARVYRFGPASAVLHDVPEVTSPKW